MPILGNVSWNILFSIKNLCEVNFLHCLGLFTPTKNLNTDGTATKTKQSVFFYSRCLFVCQVVKHQSRLDE